MFLRYLDDIFIFWLQQEVVLASMVNMNSIRSSIQFTREKERNNLLTFLDVLITRTEQRLKISVYGKPAFTRQYLNFN